jgi:hypothetical protein
MNRDTVFYMLKNFVDVKSIVRDWMPVCRNLRRMLLDPNVLIDYKLNKYREDHPVIGLYLKRGKTQALIYTQPYKFLVACEKLEKPVIKDACTMLKRIFPAYTDGNLAGVDQILGEAEKQKFAANFGDYYGILIPPQYAEFYSLCCSANVVQQGLTFTPPKFKPSCWHFNVCEGIMQFAEWSDQASDGASFLYLICDIHSPWYGRFVYYSYRRDRKFHMLPNHWSFTEFLQLLVDNEDLAKKHLLEALLSRAAVASDTDTDGNVEKPIGHFHKEVLY